MIPDPREEWILERMAIMEEGASVEERRERKAGDLRRLAEQDWERLQQARKPKTQGRMF